MVYVSKIESERERGGEDIETITTYFRRMCYVELVEDGIANHIDEGYSKIKQSFEEFNSRGSNWIHQILLYRTQYYEVSSLSKVENRFYKDF